jgi:hypothetical protein
MLKYYQGIIDKKTKNSFNQSVIAMLLKNHYPFVSVFLFSKINTNFELGKVSVEELKQRVHPIQLQWLRYYLKKENSFKYENERDSMHFMRCQIKNNI